MQNAVVVVVTGRVMNMDRMQISALIKQRGGVTEDRVTKKTSVLVAEGYPHGRDTVKIKTAKKHGIPIINDIKFKAHMDAGRRLEDLPLICGRLPTDDPNNAPSKPSGPAAASKINKAINQAAAKIRSRYSVTF